MNSGRNSHSRARVHSSPLGPMGPSARASRTAAVAYSSSFARSCDRADFGATPGRSAEISASMQSQSRLADMGRVYNASRSDGYGAAAGYAIPTVSIILPTFNRTRWLEPAIDSVLGQTFADWELIIADDGSSEETQNYLRGIETQRIRILWLSHGGNPSRARNAALDVASGKYVAFIDSDDVWSPHKLDRQLAAMQASRSRWSYTACDRIDADGRLLAAELQPATPLRNGWIFEQLLALEVSVAMPA